MKDYLDNMDDSSVGWFSTLQSPNMLKNKIILVSSMYSDYEKQYDEDLIEEASKEHLVSDEDTK